MILLYCTQLHFDLTPFRANPPLIPGMKKNLHFLKVVLSDVFIYAAIGF